MRLVLNAESQQCIGHSRSLLILQVVQSLAKAPLVCHRGNELFDVWVDRRPKFPASPTQAGRLLCWIVNGIRRSVVLRPSSSEAAGLEIAAPRFALSRRVLARCTPISNARNHASSTYPDFPTSIPL